MSMEDHVESNTDSSSVSDPPPADASAERDYQAASQAVHLIPQLLAQLRDRALYYVSLRMGLLRARARSALWLVIIAAVMLVIVVAALVTSVVLLLIGASNGLGELFGGRYWLGDMIVGAGAVALFGFALRSLIAGAQRRALDA